MYKVTFYDPKRDMMLTKHFNSDHKAKVFQWDWETEHGYKPMIEEISDRPSEKHVRKYRRLNKQYGLKWTEKDLPDGWTKKVLRDAIVYRTDGQLLNFIPLGWWDSRANFIYPKGLSLAEKVCMLKQACLDFVLDGKD